MRRGDALADGQAQPNPFGLGCEKRFEQLRAELAQYDSDPAFSTRERACIALAELFAMDPSAIDDASFAAVRGELGEAGTVALLEALAVFDGFARFQAVLGAAPAEGEAA